MTSDQPTLIETIEADPTRSLDLAAAKLAMAVDILMSAMLRTSGSTQKDIAERIGVSEGRVSQVINSDGNLRIAALARYAGAMGYTIELGVTPLAGAAPLPKRERRTRKTAAPRVTTVGASKSFPLEVYGVFELAGTYDGPVTVGRNDFALAAYHQDLDVRI